MLIKRPADIAPSEITQPELYFGRRRFLRDSAGAVLVATMPGLAWAPPTLAAAKLAATKNPDYVVDDDPTPKKYVTTYNNFYEFGTGKDDPVENAKDFNPKPWSVVVSGECEKPGRYHFEDIIKPSELEERIYRFRCVEAWSMVVPWIGVPLATVLKRFNPTAKAKYVAFETLYDPKRMPGQRRPVLNWPYVEGLRIDEAMHPLTLLTVGLYGEELPNQNGAPIRLIVPWKYGFKSIKSIVRIKFTEKQPPTTWNDSAPQEYGFYSNVNPQVDHPRWSQRKERKVGGGFFSPKVPTLKFNGYAEQVAALYTGMDLVKFY
ncbi:MAG: protein-methionine-sulfoxide reductase catalytic subunit MsrP [Gammaproteobacteria bacterium]|nr:protein-methionine-sulfoxide reductase catalytic subunit MsrP [Gammaproteobacteria bacterium]